MASHGWGEQEKFKSVERSITQNLKDLERDAENELGADEKAWSGTSAVGAHAQSPFGFTPATRLQDAKTLAEVYTPPAVFRRLCVSRLQTETRRINNWFKTKSRDVKQTGKTYDNELKTLQREMDRQFKSVQKIVDNDRRQVRGAW